ncbi:HAD family hydrolase [Olsenella profusa]|uniref:HAD hydrolase, family IA, variant 3 n=1 Tax=Olsenella profusa F0195 TaxID=1125712 RepID=U2TKF4_9ACTN|nr:HAD family phosphatase [Olsenella profusa]ERL06945.1 HAD hydrolase, family IA, variant 3 [Olsenella profusa F0195]
MAKKGLYIFDFDGLLVDTERVYREGWRTAFDRAGLDMPDSELESWVGRSIDYTSAAVERRFHDPDLYPRLYALREEYVYGAIAAGGIKPKPFALHALRVVHDANRHVCVVSSSLRRRVVAIAERLGFLGLVDHIVASEDVGQRKPNPEPYQKALEKFECSPSTAVAFEDSLTGRHAAFAAGIDVWLVPDTSSPAFEIPDGIACASDLRIALRLLDMESGV